MNESKGLDANFLYKYLVGSKLGRNGISPKSAMSDTAIMKIGGRVVEFPGGWTEGHVAFLETTPTKRPSGWDAEEQEQTLDNGFLCDGVAAIANGTASARTVWPVAVKLAFLKHGCNTQWEKDNPENWEGKIVQFSDGGTWALWFDGKYIAALLKRCNRNRQIEYSIAEQGTGFVLVVTQDDNVVGFLSPLALPNGPQDSPVSVRVCLPEVQDVQPVVHVAPVVAVGPPLVESQPVRVVRKTRRSCRPVLVGRDIPMPDSLPLPPPSFVIVTNSLGNAQPCYV